MHFTRVPAYNTRGWKYPWIRVSRFEEMTGTRYPPFIPVLCLMQKWTNFAKLKMTLSYVGGNQWRVYTYSQVVNWGIILKYNSWTLGVQDSLWSIILGNWAKSFWTCSYEWFRQQNNPLRFVKELFWVWCLCLCKDRHGFLPAGSGTSGKSKVLTRTQRVVTTGTHG